MKQDLWLANSALMLLLFGSVEVYELLQQEPPSWKPVTKIDVPEIEKKKEEAAPTVAVWEKVYQDDIFGTYIPVERKATKQSLITPIPEPRPPVFSPPPEPKKQEFIPALTITVRGIIIGNDEAKNVALIADETNKEGMYHLGEKVKDAQIIKIATNRVILLRANGQQEIFYLRKDDSLDEQLATEKWKYIVKRVDDQTFEVDPSAFVKEVRTLGNFIERSGVVGTAYASGKPIGIRLGKIQPNDVGSLLGLIDNDILTSINGINVTDAAGRIKGYDIVTRLPLGQTVKVGLRRANAEVFFTYKLARIEPPRKRFFGGVKPADQAAAGPVSPQTGLPMNRLQQQEQTMRDFNARHFDPEKHRTTMTEIRQRILDGLRDRLRNARGQ